MMVVLCLGQVQSKVGLSSAGYFLTQSRQLSSPLSLRLLSTYLVNMALSVLIFLLFSAAASVTATDHIVGANKGWNPGINYTLWANNQTFYVGDLISFRYIKTQYNVFEVNQTGYDNCTIEGAFRNWTKGKDFILLDKAKRYYFICGTGGCPNGMKVSVVVHPLPSPPRSAIAAEHSSKNSAAPVAECVFGSLLAMSFSFFGLALYGSV